MTRRLPTSDAARLVLVIVWSAVVIAATARGLRALIDGPLTGESTENAAAALLFLLTGGLIVGGVALIFRRGEPSPKVRLLIVALLVVAIAATVAANWSTWSDIQDPPVPV